MLNRGFRRQFLAVLSGNLAMMSAGFVLVWSSPALPKLPHLSPAEVSWLASLPSLGAAVGPWLGGWTADRLGRRRTALLAALPMVAGWLVLLFTEHRPPLQCAARFVTGLGVGFVGPPLGMYSAEITQANYRGALCALLQPSMTLGNLIAYCVGPFVSYRTLTAVGLAAPVVFVACFFWVPESPYYLLAVGKDREAEDALRWLRDAGRDVASELSNMKRAVSESGAADCSPLRLFRTRRSRLALAISLGIVCSDQLSGINAVLFYMQDIFDAAGGAVDSRLAPIIVSGSMLAESLVTPFLADRLGRRVLLIFSSVGMSLALTSLAVFFYWSDTGRNVDYIGWLPVTALMFFVLTYTPGYGANAFTVSLEIFAPDTKATALSIAVFLSWFTSFLVSKFFEDIRDAVGNYGPFFLFAGCNVLSSFFVYFMLPETKGKTLEEIQVMLEQRYKQ